jgi:hypothetical protein
VFRIETANKGDNLLHQQPVCTFTTKVAKRWVEIKNSSPNSESLKPEARLSSSHAELPFQLKLKFWNSPFPVFFRVT